MKKKERHVNIADGLLFIMFLFAVPLIFVATHFYLEARLTAEEKSEMSVRIDDDVLRAEFEADVTLAEGRVMSVYLEPISERPHGGIGHLLTPADFAKGLRIGDVLNDAQVQIWFETDYHIALHGALETFPDFDTFPDLVQLAILNWLWQLGASAPEKFPRATAALQAREWRTAASEWLYADARSKRWSRWRLETQHRCEQEAERLQHVAAMEE